MHSSGRLVILSGPSGVGKDTVIRAWKEADPRVKRVVAYTTRHMRHGEAEGIDYHFVSRERFEEMIREGAFLEHKEVHGNLYGTPLKDMERLLSEGSVAVLKIDVQGAIDVMKLRPDALSVFLAPPSIQELESRLRLRGQDSDDVIQKRVRNAHEEMSLAGRYQHIIVNDYVDHVVRRLLDLTREVPELA